MEIQADTGTTRTSRKKRLLRAGLDITIFLVVLFAAQRLLMQLFGRHTVLLMGTQSVIISAFLFLRHRPLLRRSGLVPRHAIRDLGLGFIGGAVIFSSVILVMGLAGWYHIVHFHPDHIFWLVGWVAILFLAAFIEEFLTRGLLFRLVEKRAGTWLALAASALFFGGGHLGNPNSSWIAAVAIAVEAGVLLAAAYMITRTLWLPIGMHMAWNLFEGPIFGTRVSGLNMNAVTDSVTRGPHLWTGGGFGPEAGLSAMIVGTFAGAVLLLVAWRQGQFRSRRQTEPDPSKSINQTEGAQVA